MSRVPLDFGFYTSILFVYFIYFIFFMYVFNCSLYCVSWNCFACTFVTQLIKINQSINQSIIHASDVTYLLLYFSVSCLAAYPAIGRLSAKATPH